MPSVPVELGDRRYEVRVEPTALERLGAIVRGVAPHDRCAMIADAEVARLYADRALASLRAEGYAPIVHAIEPGEGHKTLDTVRAAYDAMLGAKLERKSPVVALGGGVVGDTAGFVAATYLRGVPFVQCPTSLLAMVDASVGGKVGVNVPQGKNLIGAFHQPAAVVIDPLVLQTLPPREMRCGLAECVKHGVIRDAGLFRWIGDHLAEITAGDPDTLAKLIAANVAVKASVVVEDERESGVRAHLNFGHTFAHAIEATAGYGVIEHGEAVALGMVAAARMAIGLGRCDAAVIDPLLDLLGRIGLPTRADLAPTPDLMNAMTLDKKVAGSRIRFVLPTELGAVEVVDDVPTAAVEAAWQSIRAD